MYNLEESLYAFFIIWLVSGTISSILLHSIVGYFVSIGIGLLGMWAYDLIFQPI